MDQISSMHHSDKNDQLDDCGHLTAERKKKKKNVLSEAVATKAT